jgi:hypothetical protein
MTNNKQTAVEWLREQLINSGLDYPINEASKIFAKAKEMEKQQIKDAYNEGEFNQRL